MEGILRYVPGYHHPATLLGFLVLSDFLCRRREPGRGAARQTDAAGTGFVPAPLRFGTDP
jgi:hypothetical protein